MIRESWSMREGRIWEGLECNGVKFPIPFRTSLQSHLNAMSDQEQARKDFEVEREKLERVRSKSYLNDGMAARQKILHATLHVESIVAYILARKLGVHEQKVKWLRLSFATQIDMLHLLSPKSSTELKALNRFKLIRNGMIHDLNINSFSKCLDDSTKEKRAAKKYVLHLVKQDLKSRALGYEEVESEEILSWGIDLLTEQIIVASHKLNKEVMERDSYTLYGLHLYDMLRTTVLGLNTNASPFTIKAKEVFDSKRNYTYSEVIHMINGLKVDLATFMDLKMKESFARVKSEMSAPAPSGQASAQDDAKASR